MTAINKKLHNSGIWGVMGVESSMRQRAEAGLPALSQARHEEIYAFDQKTSHPTAGEYVDVQGWATSRAAERARLFPELT